MSTKIETLHVLDVSPEDQAELAALLPEGEVQFEEAKPGPDGSRDIPTVVAIVSISLAALRVLAIWITRHTQSQQTEVAIETHKADGSTKTLLYRSRNSSSQTDAEVLKQLAAACNVEVPEGLEEDE